MPFFLISHKCREYQDPGDNEVEKLYVTDNPSVVVKFIKIVANEFANEIIRIDTIDNTKLKKVLFDCETDDFSAIRFNGEYVVKTDEIHWDCIVREKVTLLNVQTISGERLFKKETELGGIDNYTKLLKIGGIMQRVNNRKVGTDEDNI